jgi:virginiamycin A acetyltransferase
VRLVVTPEIITTLREKRVMFEYRLIQYRLREGDILEFSESATVEPYSAILEGFAIPTIGAFSYARSALPAGVKIGRYCSIATGVSVPMPRHPIELVTSSIAAYGPGSLGFSLITAAVQDLNPEFTRIYPNPQKPMPIIGHDVWIGADVSLMPGITIGHGAVLASGAVVTKSVEPYAIVGGNPGKVLRKRFSDSTIAALLESEWWRYKFTDFGDMGLDEPDRFCDQLKEANLQPYEPEPLRFASFEGAWHEKSLLPRR